MTGSIVEAGPVRAGGPARRWRSGMLAVSIVLASVTAGCTSAGDSALQQRVDELEKRLQTTEDVQAIERLTRAYGYYVDKAQWDEIVDLFAEDSRVEIAGRGVYHGKEGADTIFRKVMGRGKNGLRDGSLFNHMILQGVVNIDPDGKTAHGRYRAFIQIGSYQQFALWAEGTYENVYVKENGVWKFKDLHYYATFYTPFDKGWAKTALPNNGPSKEFPPDEPQSVDYDVFPGHYIPPYHYPNPVSGNPWVPTTAPEKAQPASEGGEK